MSSKLVMVTDEWRKQCVCEYISKCEVTNYYLVRETIAVYHVENNEGRTT